MYAIVEIAGKQYKVHENDKLFVPLIDAKVDDTIELDRVLLLADNGDVTIGTPLVDDAKVSATVLEHVKADKVLVFRKIRRKRFKVTKGHRQQYTRIEIGDFSINGGKKKTTSRKTKKDAAEASEPKASKPEDAARPKSEATDEAGSDSGTVEVKVARKEESGDDQAKRRESNASSAADDAAPAVEEGAKTADAEDEEKASGPEAKAAKDDKKAPPEAKAAKDDNKASGPEAQAAKDDNKASGPEAQAAKDDKKASGPEAKAAKDDKKASGGETAGSEDDQDSEKD